MCFFVVVGVLSRNARDSIAKLPRPIRARLEPEYGGLHVHLSGYDLYVLTEGGCSCSLYAPRQEESSQRPVRLRKKWQKRGWSQDKIERALSDLKPVPVREAGLRSDVRFWIADTAEASGKVAVFVHWATDKIPESPAGLEVNVSEVRRDGNAIGEAVLFHVLKNEPRKRLPQ